MADAGVSTNYHCPRANFPSLDSPVQHVGIGACEGFCHLRALATEDQQSSVGGFSQCSSQYHLTASMSLSRKSQMLLTIDGAAGQVIIHQIVEQHIVWHVSFLLCASQIVVTC